MHTSALNQIPAVAITPTNAHYRVAENPSVNTYVCMHICVHTQKHACVRKGTYKEIVILGRFSFFGRI